MARNFRLWCSSLLMARQVPAGGRIIKQFRMLSDDTDNKLNELQKDRFNASINTESLDQRKARLIYQSRKRGNLENGILLSTFADEFIDTLSSQQLLSYDALINLPENDWDLYYWMTGAKEAPKEFQSDVLSMLKDHTKNKGSKLRNQQPPIRGLKTVCK